MKTDATQEQPLRRTVSRQELSEELIAWMVELWGANPKDLPPSQRAKWHEQEGLIHHFIRDRFPI